MSGQDSLDEFTSDLILAFDNLNLMLFEGKLNKVKFAFRVKKKCCIKYDCDNQIFYLGSEITDCDINDIPNLLLHEMIHAYNHQNIIKDVTANQYHNKHFLATALEVGLIVLKHRTQGWGITLDYPPRNVINDSNIKTPDPQVLKKRIAAYNTIKFSESNFELARNYIFEQIRSQNQPTKLFQLKYKCKCPEPHNSIRSGRRPDGNNPLTIRCLDCQSIFVCES